MQIRALLAGESWGGIRLVKGPGVKLPPAASSEEQPQRLPRAIHRQCRARLQAKRESQAAKKAPVPGLGRKKFTFEQVAPVAEPARCEVGVAGTKRWESHDFHGLDGPAAHINSFARDSSANRSAALARGRCSTVHGVEQYHRHLSH